ncbi:hypothetical protein Tco_0105422 [Tanacetum coccineum]
MIRMFLRSRIENLYGQEYVLPYRICEVRKVTNKTLGRNNRALQVFMIILPQEEERKPAPRIQQQLMLRVERKQSFHPKRILKMMVVTSKRFIQCGSKLRYMHAAAFLRWAVAANYHSRCGINVIHAYWRLKEFGLSILPSVDGIPQEPEGIQLYKLLPVGLANCLRWCRYETAIDDRIAYSKWNLRLYCIISDS